MDNFQQRDLSVLWHPCTQMKDNEKYPVLEVASAHGIYLTDPSGKQYIDAISSWWVNLFGHTHPYINTAIKQQLDTLEHVMLAGLSHEPVVRLSERLLALAPDGLSRCFYSDNGSTAIEVALKMSFHYWQNQGQPKKQRFVTLTNSYHGETLGALSVGHHVYFKKAYEPLLLKTLVAPSPDCFHRSAGMSWREYSLQQFAELEAILAQHADQVCAVFIEPLVQCAGYMRMYHPVYLENLRAACDHYNVHLIADEIAVGFGRTGTMFACEQAQITPDFLCLSKGLTGGYLPLSVTLTNDQIYQAFYDDFDKLRAFLHSHSYCGNALACSAANATLDLFAASPVLENNQLLATVMGEAMAPLTDHPHVAEIRQCGMILAVEIVADKATRQHYPWQERRGWQIYQDALQHGVLLRPLGDVIYMMPPYIITPAEIQQMAQVAIDAIIRVTAT